MYVQEVGTRSNSYLYHRVLNDAELTSPLFILRHESKGQAKAIPLQAWTGPEDSRRVRLPDFKAINT
jgi:hypothetical protein